MSDKDILRFGKFGNGGRPPGMCIKPVRKNIYISDNVMSKSSSKFSLESYKHKNNLDSPGIVRAGLTDRGMLCEGGAWLSSGTVGSSENLHNILLMSPGLYLFFL